MQSAPFAKLKMILQFQQAIWPQWKWWALVVWSCKQIQDYIPEFNSAFVDLWLKQQSVEIFEFHPQGICYYVSGVIPCPPLVTPSSIIKLNFHYFSYPLLSGSMCTIYYCIGLNAANFGLNGYLCLKNHRTLRTCSWSLEYILVQQAGTKVNDKSNT